MNMFFFFFFAFLYEINTVVFIAYFCAAWRIKLPQGYVEWWVAKANATEVIISGSKPLPQET